MAERTGIFLVETRDRNFGFAIYDELRKMRGAYVEAEMKVMADTIKIYAIPFYPVEELQPGPRRDFDDTMLKWKYLCLGFEAGWKARSK